MKIMYPGGEEELLDFVHAEAKSTSVVLDTGSSCTLLPGCALLYPKQAGWHIGWGCCSLSRIGRPVQHSILTVSNDVTGMAPVYSISTRRRGTSSIVGSANSVSANPSRVRCWLLALLGIQHIQPRSRA